MRRQYRHLATSTGFDPVSKSYRARGRFSTYDITSAGRSANLSVWVLQRILCVCLLGPVSTRRLTWGSPSTAFPHPVLWCAIIIIIILIINRVELCPLIWTVATCLLPRPLLVCCAAFCLGSTTHCVCLFVGARFDQTSHVGEPIYSFSPFCALVRSLLLLIIL